MYYDSLYGSNNSKLSERLFDVNKQIASGLQIQYAKDDVRTFAETMRLDNEIAALGQVKMSTESGYKMSNQADIVLNEFEDTMNRMRTLLVQAANGTNDETSLDAIATELREIEDHFESLANTSINGQYLFSGTAVDVKPIASDGTYMGNDQSMNVFTGSGTEQEYNISGGDLFLGEEELVRRTITTNVINTNLIAENPALQGAADVGASSTLSVGSTIRDLMGDIDNTSAPANDHYFYVRGTRSDGTAFNEKIQMQDDDKIEELLIQIGDAYGNTPNIDVVNVTMNDYGQIVVEDKIKGSSKLDFHMVGAVDFSGAGAADVLNIDNLDGGETNFDEILNPTPPAVADPLLYVKEFVKSDLTSATGASTNIQGLIYDRTEFSKDGSTLSSNTPQIVKSDNSFATGATKISEVADISLGTVDTADDTLDGSSLRLVGVDIAGNPYDAQINFIAGGSTFSLDTDGDGVYDNGTYDIFNADSARTTVDADEMTYQQLMDVTNMLVTGNLPLANTANAYDDAIKSSNFAGGTTLSYDGKLQFKEIRTSNTQATIALYDAKSGDFTETIDSNGDTVVDAAAASVMTFNSNNALTIRDPKTDFFKSIDEMITAVENYKLYPDASGGDIRNVGIENSISMMDDLQDHIFRSHSVVGSQSNSLTSSLERTQLLEISTMTLRSSVIDTDLAEASLELTQLTLNYEAMLSTVGQISKLSLVNYL
jgi:flagellar hook-associated protein 3 FlgL